MLQQRLLRLSCGCDVCCRWNCWDCCLCWCLSINLRSLSNLRKSLDVYIFCCFILCWSYPDVVLILQSLLQGCGKRCLITYWLYRHGESHIWWRNVFGPNSLLRVYELRRSALNDFFRNYKFAFFFFLRLSGTWCAFSVFMAFRWGKIFWRTFFCHYYSFFDIEIRRVFFICQVWSPILKHRLLESLEEHWWFLIHISGLSSFFGDLRLGVWRT